MLGWGYRFCGKRMLIKSGMTNKEAEKFIKIFDEVYKTKARVYDLIQLHFAYLPGSISVFAVEENGRVFGGRKVDVIKSNFLVSAQRNLNLIKCWQMNVRRMSTETQQVTVDCFGFESERQN